MLQNSLMPWLDSARPYPELRTPPNGSSAYDVVIPLTNTAPASRPAMKSSRSAGSLVQAFEPSPKAVAFASSSASAADDTRYSPATGPNTSSAYIAMSGVRSPTTVGRYHQPGWSSRFPPHSTDAPRETASRTCSSRSARPCSVASGPTSVPSVIGSPTFNADMLATNAAVNAS